MVSNSSSANSSKPPSQEGTGQNTASGGLESPRQSATQRDGQETPTELVHLRIELANAQQQIAHLERKIQDQQSEITAHKDELFRVQPMEQITDSRVLEKYACLGESIRNWVDGEISKFEDCGGDLAQVNNVSKRAWERNVLRHSPASLECLVEAKIQRLLQGSIFRSDEEFYGLDHGDISLIKEASICMPKLEPPRDAASVNFWRSEAIKGLAISPRVTERRQWKLKVLAQELLNSLNESFPFVRNQPENLSKLHREIIVLAAEVESSIHMSSVDYQFSAAKVPALPPSFPSIPRTLLDEFTCIEVCTRKRVKSSMATTADSETPIGVLIQTVEPGLLRKDAQGLRCLQKERVLVHIFNNSHKQ